MTQKRQLKLGALTMGCGGAGPPLGPHSSQRGLF